MRQTEQVVAWLVEALERIGETKDNFAIIHADLHPGNFLVQDGEVSVIDFDQMGWGHYGFDLAVLMVELNHKSMGYAKLWQDFKAGYTQIAAWPFAAERKMNPFVLGVNLAFLDWVYNSSNPAVRRQLGQRLPPTFESISVAMGI